MLAKMATKTDAVFKLLNKAIHKWHFLAT